MFYTKIMERIGVRELNQNTSRYLARVKAGETLEVTEHGRTIAKLVPAQREASVLERLVATGEAEPPTADLSSLATLPPLEPDGIDVAAELAASREEERW